MTTFLLAMLISFASGVLLRKRSPLLRSLTIVAVSLGLCFAYFFLNKI